MSGQAIVKLSWLYFNSTKYVQTRASCGGFVGILDSFGAALWALDYAMHGLLKSLLRCTTGCCCLAQNEKNKNKGK
jgi:hypothetical protein